MEVERLCVFKFYYYYYFKRGMWGIRNMFNLNDCDKFGCFDDNSEIILLYNEMKE